VGEQHTETRRRAAADSFARFCVTATSRPPLRFVAPNFLGFALINGFTFAVDLVLLTIFHGWWKLPVWLAITLSYLIAFGFSFVLNRTLNFRSHSPVGRQTAWYAAAIAANYFVFLLGVGGGLVAFGLEYHLSRIVAGACEGVFMYCAMRWVVFPPANR
jgi:putative flippase GtrA